MPCIYFPALFLTNSQPGHRLTQCHACPHHSARAHSPYIVAPRQVTIAHAPRCCASSPAVAVPAVAHPSVPMLHAIALTCTPTITPSNVPSPARLHLAVSSRTSRALAHACTCCRILVFELSRTLAAAHHPIHTVVAHSCTFTRSRASRAVLMSSPGMPYHPRALAPSSAPLLHGRTVLLGFLCCHNPACYACIPTLGSACSSPALLCTYCSTMAEKCSWAPSA